MDKLKYAKLLYACRKKAKLSQRELCCMTGVSEVTIYNYESGRTMPVLPKYEALLNACGYELEIIKNDGTDIDISAIPDSD